jgi:DNA-binding CsgD family transcriptional regulator
MKLKLGIVGHRGSIAKISKVVQDHFADIEIVEIRFEEYAQTTNLVNYLKIQEKHLDGILFTGKIPYEIINNQMISLKPWTYIKRENNQLIRTLLEASLHYQYDVQNISIDSYSKESVEMIYEELNIPKGEYKAFVSTTHILNNSLIEILKAFHANNYYTHHVSVCITGISSIYEYLKAENIPCIMIEPTSEAIKQAIQHFRLKHEFSMVEDRQIVVIAIEMDMPNEYSLINENEYQLMLNKMKVAEEIYLFAQKIQAAVVEIGFRGYLLFGTKKILELETNNINELKILASVSSNTANTISIGVGYGITAREAKYNANQGMIKAKNEGGNKGYLVFYNKVIGPIVSEKENGEGDLNLIDASYLRIAETAGISINTIYKLHCMIEQNKKNSYTSIELADELGISVRSVNRIVSKLEVNGFVTQVGKKIVSGAGRPSRIIKILF